MCSVKIRCAVLVVFCSISAARGAWANPPAQGTRLHLEVRQWRAERNPLPWEKPASTVPVRTEARPAGERFTYKELKAKIRAKLDAGQTLPCAAGELKCALGDCQCPPPSPPPSAVRPRYFIPSALLPPPGPRPVARMEEGLSRNVPPLRPFVAPMPRLQFGTIAPKPLRGGVLVPGTPPRLQTVPVCLGDSAGRGPGARVGICGLRTAARQAVGPVTVVLGAAAVATSAPGTAAVATGVVAKEGVRRLVPVLVP